MCFFFAAFFLFLAIDDPPFKNLMNLLTDLIPQPTNLIVRAKCLSCNKKNHFS